MSLAFWPAIFKGVKRHRGLRFRRAVLPDFINGILGQRHELAIRIALGHFFAQAIQHFYGQKARIIADAGFALELAGDPVSRRVLRHLQGLHQLKVNFAPDLQCVAAINKNRRLVAQNNSKAQPILKTR